jgi:hypothetical protein
MSPDWATAEAMVRLPVPSVVIAMLGFPAVILVLVFVAVTVELP